MPESLDEQVRDHERRLTDVEHLIHGGGTVRWDDSLRGRVHRLLNNEAREKYLAEAARDLRRVRGRSWSHRERLAALVVAALAAAAPYVLFFLAH